MYYQLIICKMIYVLSVSREHKTWVFPDVQSRTLCLLSRNILIHRSLSYRFCNCHILFFRFVTLICFRRLCTNLKLITHACTTFSHMGHPSRVILSEVFMPVYIRKFLKDARILQ